MSFLVINGLAVDAYYDNFVREYKDLQTFDRTEGLTYEGALFATKREWTFEMPWEPSTDKAIAFRDWIKGRGHYWTFDRISGVTTQFNRYSAEGGPGWTGSVTAATPSKFGAWALSTASGFTSVVSVGFGNEGRYSFSGWKRDSTGTFINVAATYDGTTTRFFSGAGALTTAFAWSTVSAVSGSLVVTLKGTDQTGAATTGWVDGVWIVPYSMTTAQITARGARTAAEPVFPYVDVSGDFLEDLFPITVKGFIEHEQMKQVQNGGQANARLMKIHLVEK